MGPVQKPASEFVEGHGRQPQVADGIEVRHCSTLAEFDECVRLQEITWGQDILVPSAVFVVAHETGGQIIGAYEGAKLVGFTLALAGFHDTLRLLHSHMTAVLTEVQNRGVGRRLKLVQRQDALERGIPLVEWTFDPLELKNAHFNIVRLGAVIRRLIPNCYGITASPLHSGLPTDRLLAEWWIDSPRVRSVVDEGKPCIPGSGQVARVSLPANIGELKNRDRAAAEAIQTRVRNEFQSWFARDYVVTGLEPKDLNIDYVLEPAAECAGRLFPKRSS
jgi:predicted GNAT superfamily acetyltransferase